jgi:hypothetical protein
MTDRQKQKLKAIRKAAPVFHGYSTFSTVLKVTFENKHGRVISQFIDQRGYIRRSFQDEVCTSCDC